MIDSGTSDYVSTFSVGKRTRASIASAKVALEEKKETSVKKKHKKVDQLFLEVV